MDMVDSYSAILLRKTMAQDYAAMHYYNAIVHCMDMADPYSAILLRKIMS